jgi:hypothetical protein
MGAQRSTELYEHTFFLGMIGDLKKVIALPSSVNKERRLA